MRKLLIAVGLLVASTTTAQVISIADARNTSLGQTVTVSGVVTNGSEFGGIRYLQDGTGGIAAYGGPQINSVNRYDSITVTGPLTEFNGLLEIGTGQPGGHPVITNHGQATVIPQPLTVPIGAVSEAVEGQLITIHNVTFVSTGNFAGNTTYQITNGSTTLDLRNNTGTTLTGTAIPTGTVSITGVVGQFNANYQIIPRGTADIVPYVAPDREINVIVNGNTYLSGSTVYMGPSTTAAVNIQNLGVGNLNISGTAFTGAQAAAFTSDIPNGDLGPESDNLFTVTLTPATIGSHNATLTISNNDADESQYVIHFQGGGTDGLATQPSANPTNLTFSTNKAYKLDAQFTAAAGSPNYLVLWNNGAAVSGTPVDGTTYLRGDTIGNAKVAYVGSANSFTPRGVIANQNYHFAIYAFNGQGGIENYNTTSPLVGNVTSNGEEIGNYYSSIDPEASTFVADLKALVNPHTMITYYNYLQTMMNNFAVRDTTGGQTYVECQYSGHKEVFTGNFTWTAADFSREHVFAHSWMPGNPYNNSNPENPQYNDQHNLFPVKMTGVNSIRSNYPFGNVVTAQNTYLDAKRGTDANGNVVYEPRDEIKGDVARALMYMAVTYNNTNGVWAFPSNISFIIPYGQDAEVIRQWHYQDLPDAYEIARNEYIFSVQGNRNPFIDSVDFACYINFGNMTHTACNLSVNEVLSSSDLSIFPVPANNLLNVEVSNTQITSYELLDLQGRVIATEQTKNNSVVIDVANFVNGTYLLKVNTPKGEVTKKVIIN